MEVVIIFRLHKYRRTFSAILSDSSTTKSRFLRLLFIAVVLIFAVLPLSVHAVIWPLQAGMHPFSWNRVHNINWTVGKYPSGGRLLQWDGVVAIICGYLLFVGFGLGSDAISMYKQWARKIGLAHIVPRLDGLRNSRSHHNSATSTNADRSKLVDREALREINMTEFV